MNFPMLKMLVQNEVKSFIHHFHNRHESEDTWEPCSLLLKIISAQTTSESKCGFLINFLSDKDNINTVYLAKDDVSLEDKRKIWHDFKEMSENSGFSRHKSPLSGEVAMRIHWICLLMHTFMSLDFLQPAVK